MKCSIIRGLGDDSEESLIMNHVVRFYNRFTWKFGVLWISKKVISYQFALFGCSDAPCRVDSHQVYSTPLCQDCNKLQRKYLFVNKLLF